MVRYAGGVSLVAVFLIFPTGALYIIKFPFCPLLPPSNIDNNSNFTIKKDSRDCPRSKCCLCIDRKEGGIELRFFFFSAVQFSPSFPPSPLPKKIHYVITPRAVYAGDSFTGFALIAVTYEKHLIWSFEIYSINKIW